MRTDELDYDLPERLIAQAPAERREAARLLVVRGGEELEHRTVADLPELLRAGDLLVINDTRVVPARFFGLRASTGGKVEGLFIEASDDDATWHVMLRSGGRLRAGERVRIADLDGRPIDDEHLELVEAHADGSWRCRRHSAVGTLALLERIGVMPLPPYIHRDRAERRPLDVERYQTVYAREPGAVAAPTAGLHLTEALMGRLAERGVELARVTLHVGLGTFQPVRAATLEGHEMHRERFEAPAATIEALRGARAEGRRVIPVGTTSVRALESLPDPLPEGGHRATTDLLIQPGYAFRFADGLMTNFHLPRSTLIALVAAKVGLDRLKRVYAEAVRREYRFYSYGDAMLILA